MDDEQREFYAKMKTEGTLLSSEQSATKLVSDFWNFCALPVCTASA
jgi:hypothetical protein